MDGGADFGPFPVDELEQRAVALDDAPSVTTFKLTCIVLVFFVALAGGLFPTRLRSMGRRERFLSLGNALSGGVFLSAGMTHLLPHAVIGFEEDERKAVAGDGDGHEHADGESHTHGFPTAYAFCLAGMLGTLLLEKWVEGLHVEASSPTTLSALEMGHTHSHAHHSTSSSVSHSHSHSQVQLRTVPSPTVGSASGGVGSGDTCVGVNGSSGNGNNNGTGSCGPSSSSATAAGGIIGASTLSSSSSSSPTNNAGVTVITVGHGGGATDTEDERDPPPRDHGHGGHHSHPHSQQGLLFPLMVAVLLSFHSLVEGVALGVEETVAETSEVLLAILAHKLFAAFALGTNLVTGNVPRGVRNRALLAFAAMTPAGALVGMALGSVTEAAAHSYASNAVKAIAAGTFLYVGLVEVVGPEFEKKADRGLKAALLAAGALGMSVLAIWA